MKKTHVIAIQVVLLATGAYAAKKLSSSMFDDGLLNPQPNVLHLKRSPFGRTLALAMRGPVDVYWHRGAPHSHANGESCSEEHEHGPDCSSANPVQHDHDHGGIGHQYTEAGSLSNAINAVDAELNRLNGPDSEASGAEGTSAGDEGLRQSLLGQIKSMRTAYYSRTNNNAETHQHKAFIMGETQKRLKISFEMDPSNIACYGAYFLFLSEALARVEGDEGEAGVIKQRQGAALTLADYTVRYCLNFTDEAPAMITAATAAHDYFQVYLSQPDPNPRVAGGYLQTIDQCIMQYEKLRRTMQEDGRWEKFSIHRLNELENAYALILKLRDLDHEIFSRLTSTPAAVKS